MHFTYPLTEHTDGLFKTIDLFGLLLQREDRNDANRRGEQYIGRVFTLDGPIVNGVGKIRVDDTSWKINGPECKAGAKVTVTGVDGVVLRVECSEPS